MPMIVHDYFFYIITSLKFCEVHIVETCWMTFHTQYMEAAKSYGRFWWCSIIASQGPRVNDEKLKEICSAVVEGSLCSPRVDQIKPSARLRHSPFLQSRPCLFLSRTTWRVYEGVPQETSSPRCPRYPRTSRTSRIPGTSRSGGRSRPPRAKRHQRPSGFLWTSRSTGQKRSEGFGKLFFLKDQRSNDEAKWHLFALE